MQSEAGHVLAEVKRVAEVQTKRVENVFGMPKGALEYDQALLSALIQVVGLNCHIPYSTDIDVKHRDDDVRFVSYLVDLFVDVSYAHHDPQQPLFCVAIKVHA